MTGRVLEDRSERLARAQAALASCDHPDDRYRRRPRAISPTAIERGAIAIYGRVIGCDWLTAERKWNDAAREITKTRHRAEAEACLNAAAER